MEYEDYGLTILAHNSEPLPERLQSYREAVAKAGSTSLSEYEQQLADIAVKNVLTGERPLLHGAPDGLTVGDTVLPAPGGRVIFTDVPYLAEQMADRSRQAGVGRCVYVVEPELPITQDLRAVRLALFCTMDLTMDRDSPQYMQGCVAMAGFFFCPSAKVLQVLDLSTSDGPRN